MLLWVLFTNVININNHKNTSKINKKINYDIKFSSQTNHAFIICQINMLLKNRHLTGALN